MENPIESPVPPSPIRPRRVWLIALGTGLFAAAIAWGVEEASLMYYGPQLTVKAAPRDYRPDLRVRLPGEPGGMPPSSMGQAPPQRPRGGGGNSPYGGARAANAYRQEFTAKAVALPGAAVGGMFGMALGMALGLSGGRSLRWWLIAISAGCVAASVCGVGGWLITRSLVPMFYKAMADKPGSPLVIASLLLIRGVPRIAAGLAGGLALGVAVGGGRRGMSLGAIGGMIGAGLGVVLVVVGDELIALLSSQSEIATSPILRSATRRIIAILAVSLPSAACAAWAILNVKPRVVANPKPMLIVE